MRRFESDLAGRNLSSAQTSRSLRHIGLGLGRATATRPARRRAPVRRSLGSRVRQGSAAPAHDGHPRVGQPSPERRALAPARPPWRACGVSKLSSRRKKSGFAGGTQVLKPHTVFGWEPTPTVPPRRAGSACSSLFGLRGAARPIQRNVPRKITAAHTALAGQAKTA